MRIFSTLCRAAALTFLGATLAQTELVAQTFSLSDLGPFQDLPGRTDGKPNGINSQGRIAAANAVGGSYQAFLYNGSWLNLGTLGGTQALAAGIEISGRVVGYSQTTDGTQHAFLWTPGGTGGVSGNPQMKDLGSLTATSAAFGINSAGEITGYSDVPAHPAALQHAILYSGGIMTDIGLLLSLPNSFGYGINSAGHITGTAYDSSYKVPHAFFYNGTTAVDIGSSANGQAINDTDHIVGYLTANGFDHAFHYFAGSSTDLGTLGGHYSYALGINNSNVIIGGAFVDANDTVYHAFIWANNAMTDLNTRLDATGAGWTLTEADAINDRGQIVGLGTIGGAAHAFLLTPPVSQPAAPRITAVAVHGANVLISFTSTQGAVYALETEPSLIGSWSIAISGIAGNGSNVTVTNSGGANLSRRFYRVKRTSP